MEDDQLSYRDSLDLSSQSITHIEPEPEPVQDGAEPSERGDPPAPPESEPPEEEATEAERDLGTSLAELNVNQSNNNSPYSVLGRAGQPLARLCGKKLPLTRNRDREPEFV